MRADRVFSLFMLAASTSAGFPDVLANLCPAATTTTTATVTADVAEKATVISKYTVTITPTAEAQAAVSDLTTVCLSDEQAKEIVASLKIILSDPDRSVAKNVARTLIADEFLETSDSMNSLLGLPLGHTTFASKAEFMSWVAAAADISRLTTLDVFHDCSRIAWYWVAGGAGSGGEDVRGMSLLYTTMDHKQVNMAMVEFNSLAWTKKEE